ncbi:DMT superfamily drug/metabolite transporter [Staphylococcus gallinarum]|uniref:DMT superfamily drug/metabolite transporter n=1 Tax=Staphylococcus gallinarum TaxID=1293 RepID=A0A380FNT3_STAGA|nr:DMT superfamily drug/metabolite transporter [Staphylococcus gallinarum]
MQHNTEKRILGIFLAIAGASFWGLGGTVSDFLFQHRNIEINWYVTARLLISGILLLIIYKLLNPRKSIFIIFTSKRSFYTTDYFFLYSVCY